MNKEVFVARLKDARERKDITLKELAEKCNVSLSAINRYVAMTSMPTIEVAASIAEALDVSLDWLCGLKEKEDDHSEMTTGKLVRMLSRFLTTTTLINSDNKAYNAADFTYSDDGTVFVAIYQGNIPNVMDFASWHSFINLYKNGTIDEEMYSAWIEKKAQELDSIVFPIREEANCDIGSAIASTSEFPF